jgi:hypothetical protein
MLQSSADHAPNRKLVSSPRRIKPSVQISRTELSCVLRVKSYVTYQVAAFRPAGSCQRTR